MIQTCTKVKLKRDISAPDVRAVGFVGPIEVAYDPTDDSEGRDS